jgi:uncharacterized protein (TIGR04255 family)
MKVGSGNPFAGTAPPEVVIPRAPLSRVVAQVRFQGILALNEPAGIASFQEVIRDDYPIFRQEEARVVVSSLPGETREVAKNVWHFGDPKEQWIIAVSEEFIALETSVYTTRAPFIERFVALLEAAQRTFRPQFADRTGVRYVNRVQGKALERIEDLVRPEMLGLAAGLMAEYVDLNLTETDLRVPGKPGERMSLRQGLLPAQVTYDPGNVALSDSPSWILDLDTYQEEVIEFDCKILQGRISSLIDTSYRMFRWVVTEAFLQEHGGWP